MFTDDEKEALFKRAQEIGLLPTYEVRPLSVAHVDVKVGDIGFVAMDLVGSHTAHLTEQELNTGRCANGLLERLRSPATIIDIGANVGIWAMYASRVHPQAKILCVEPVRELYEVLAMNTRDSNIATMHAGIAPSGQRNVKLGWHPQNPGGASFQYATEYDSVAIAQACTIESVLDSLALKHVDFVKMDIECMEYAVINDIKDWRRIKAISVELHNNVWLPTWANKAVTDSAEAFLHDVHDKHGTLIEVRTPTGFAYTLGSP